MGLAALVYGPLVWLALATFGLGLVVKFATFVLASARHPGARSRWRSRHIVTALCLLLLPVNRWFFNKPLATAVRYGFHVLVIVVPVFVYGHIALWKESRFGWHWPALPDGIANSLTVTVIAVGAVYLARRLRAVAAGGSTRLGSCVLVVMTLLPFVTGLIIAKGTAGYDPAAAPGAMELAHVVCSAALLVLVTGLFSVIVYDRDQCTTCGACALRCPVGAIEMREAAATRELAYAHKRCVHCENCVVVCPEGAASLRHVVRPRYWFASAFESQVVSGLGACRRCGAAFVPRPQVERVRGSVAHDFMDLCPYCRKTVHAAALAAPGAGRPDGSILRGASTHGA